MTLARVVLVGLLLTAGATPATASDAEDGRNPVRVEEAGFTLDLPTDWRWELTTDATRSAFEDNVRAAGVSTMEAVRAPWLIAVGPESESCNVTVGYGYGLTLDDLVELARDEAATLTWDVDIDPDVPRLQLPAGESARLTVRISADGNEIEVSTYVILGETLGYFLACSGPAPLDDAWLSTAETFGILPGGGTRFPGSGEALGWGRIERAADGFAITFPDEMWVGAVSQAQHDALFRDDPETGDQRRTLLWARETGSDRTCRVVDLSEWAALPPPLGSIEEALLLIEEGLLGHPDWPDVEEPEIVDLPTAEGGRIVAADWTGTTHARYYLRDGERWFHVRCSATEPPADHWLSVIETFEFLEPE